MRACVCVRACVRACVRVYVCECVCVRVNVCAAAGSTVRQFDFRRSSVSLVPGCGGVCIWQTIKNNRT